MVINLLKRLFEKCITDPAWIFRTLPEGTPWIEYNRWEAAKSGLRGQFWTHKGTISAFELLKELSAELFTNKGSLLQEFNKALGHQYRWSSKTLVDEGFPLIRF